MKKSMLMSLRLDIVISIVLMVIGITIWLYADYAISSGVTSWSSSSSWYQLIYSGLIFLVVGTGVWAYFDHRGRDVLVSMALVIIGIVTWASADYSYLTGYTSPTAWYYMLGAGVVLIVVGICLWTYSNLKTKIL